MKKHCARYSWTSGIPCPAGTRFSTSVKMLRAKSVFLFLNNISPFDIRRSIVLWTWWSPLKRSRTKHRLVHNPSSRLTEKFWKSLKYRGKTSTRGTRFFFFILEKIKFNPSIYFCSKEGVPRGPSRYFKTPWCFRLTSCQSPKLSRLSVPKTIKTSVSLLHWFTHWGEKTRMILVSSTVAWRPSAKNNF